MPHNFTVCLFFQFCRSKTVKDFPVAGSRKCLDAYLSRNMVQLRIMYINICVWFYKGGNPFCLDMLFNIFFVNFRLLPSKKSSNKHEKTPSKNAESKAEGQEIHPMSFQRVFSRFGGWIKWINSWDTLPPIIMEIKNGCISNRIVPFQIVRHFPLNHDYGRKSKSVLARSSKSCKFSKFHERDWFKHFHYALGIQQEYVRLVASSSHLLLKWIMFISEMRLNLNLPFPLVFYPQPYHT